MSVEEQPVLVLPADFDDYAWEVESKGVFWEVRIQYRGLEYPLTFYEPQRLAQDVTDQLKEGRPFFEPNVVVVTKVTRENMGLAAQALVREGRIERLKSM